MYGIMSAQASQIVKERNCGKALNCFHCSCASLLGPRQRKLWGPACRNTENTHRMVGYEAVSSRFLLKPGKHNKMKPLDVNKMSITLNSLGKLKLAPAQRSTFHSAHVSGYRSHMNVCLPCRSLGCLVYGEISPASFMFTKLPKSPQEQRYHCKNCAF
jgi:hypothetical protein